MEVNVLVVEVSGSIAAIPLADVSETMRPRPVESIPDSPPLLLGYSLIRGQITPVLDLSLIISGESPASVRRFVVVRCGEYPVVLATSHVQGVFSIDASQFEKAPGLTIYPPYVQAISILNSHLLLVLRCCRLITPKDMDGLLEQCRALQSQVGTT